MLALAGGRLWRGSAAALFTRPAELRSILLLTVWFTVNNGLYLTALQKTTIANATMTHYLAPLFVAGLAWPLLGERLQPRAVAAMGTAAAGVAVMVAGSGLSLADAHFVGLLCGAGSAVFFALEVVQKKILAPSAPADVITVHYLVLAVLVLAPFARPFTLTSLRHAEMGLLLFAGVVTTALALYLFASALPAVSVQHAAVISYLEPLGAIAWGLVLIREVPDRFGLAGGGLVLVGILLIVGARSPGPRRAFDPTSHDPSPPGIDRLRGS